MSDPQLFKRPFFISPHARDRFRQRFGSYNDSEIEWMLPVQMQPPELPDAAQIDVARRGPALLYAVLVGDIKATAIVAAPSDVDITQLPRAPDVWPVIMTVYPGRKHIAKYHKYLAERTSRPAKPFKPTWEPWEIETVKLMRWIGYTMAEMAVVLHRTERQIERHVPIIRPRWTEEDLQTMCDMRASGKTFKEIGVKIGRSPQSCKNKMLRHREWVLSDPERAAFLRIISRVRNPSKILNYMRRTDMVSRVADLIYGEEEGTS
jgi:hypothetical protein